MSKPLDRRQLLRSALAAASGGLTLSERASAAGLRKLVLIERSRISGKRHYGIPILIKLTDPELRAVEQGGQVASPAGDTLFFTAGDSKTDLSHEIREYQPDRGHLEAWVRIPELHSNTDTQIYLQQRSSPQGTDAQSVWDRHYKLVVHLPEGRGPVADSSTQRNAVTRREQEASPYFVVGHSNTLSFAHELTVEAWINARGPSTDGIQALVSQWNFQESFGKFEGYDAGNTSGLVTKGFFGAVFDGRHVYFAPQHDGVARHGKVLRYDTHQPFKSSEGWEAYDASRTSDLDTRGYYGAVFDGHHVYFIPRTDGKTYHTRFLRYDTRAGFTDLSAWQAYDIGYTHSYQSAAFDGRYIYFTPGYDDGGGSAKVLRYDTHGSFTDAGSYTRYDAGNTSGLKSVNYDGAAFDGRYVYFAPLNADGIVLRLDTKSPFKSRASWTAVDVPALSGHKMHMCVGAVFDGHYIYYVPYAHSVVVRHDTRGDFTSATSWSSFEAAGTSGLTARGYDGGIFDGRYVYFLPFWQGGDAKTGFHGELLRYDTQRPFEIRSAWSAVDAGHTDGLATVGFNGGAFDGRYLYGAPWREGTPEDGKIVSHGRVLRYDTTGDRAAFSLRYAGYGHNGGLCAAQPGPTFILNTDRGTCVARANKILPRGRHHLAGIYDGHRIRLYIDGSLAAEHACSGKPQVSDADIAIGRLLDGLGHFDGEITEVRVSDIARSGDWLRTQYNTDR